MTSEPLFFRPYLHFSPPEIFLSLTYCAAPVTAATAENEKHVRGLLSKG
jgi:hypothetical protein